LTVFSNSVIIDRNIKESYENLKISFFYLLYMAVYRRKQVLNSEISDGENRRTFVKLMGHM